MLGQLALLTAEEVSRQLGVRLVRVRVRVRVRVGVRVKGEGEGEGWGEA